MFLQPFTSPLVCGTPYDIHLVFYMYAYQTTDTGKGIKAACLARIRTLLNRNLWLNPLSDVMGAGGFGIHSQMEQ